MCDIQIHFFKLFDKNEKKYKTWEKEIEFAI